METTKLKKIMQPRDEHIIKIKSEVFWCLEMFTYYSQQKAWKLTQTFIPQWNFMEGTHHHCEIKLLNRKRQMLWCDFCNNTIVQYLCSLYDNMQPINFSSNPSSAFVCEAVVISVKATINKHMNISLANLESRRWCEFLVTIKYLTEELFSILP